MPQPHPEAEFGDAGALAPLLQPHAVMLVGASHSPRKAGGAILRNLVAAKPGIPIHAVNPSRIDLPGARWSPSIADVPEPCDLAIVAVAAAQVPDVLTALGRNGTKLAIVVSAGLTRENGLRDRALDAARAAGLRVVGPNCIGALVPPAGLNASFAADSARRGGLAFLSQSGALVTAVLDWANERQIGFSAVLSVGDMADIGLAEIVRALERDERTTAILLYLEGLADARPLLAAVRALDGRKPVIALKAGRGKAAARAALSHTGALAGSYDVYRAAFRQHGIVMVETLDELFDAAAVVARTALPAGDRLGIVTNGGGAGILAADALEHLPGELASLAPATVERLSGVLPAAAATGNPVDIVGDGDGARYAAAIEAVLADPGVDALLVMNCPTALCEGEEIVEAVARAVQRSGSSKPVLACWLGDSNARRAERAFAAAGIALLGTPDDAVRGFSHLIQTRRHGAPPPVTPATDRETVEEARELIGQARADGRRVMSEIEAKRLLALFGVPVVPSILADTPADVAAACADLAAPYAVKIVSPELTHKSDIGGVALGVSDAAAGRAAAEAMLAHIRALRPEARLQGFSVQPMIRRKQAHELLCGFAHDSTFGWVLTVGAGGTAVEVLADRALRLAPIGREEAEAMLGETRVSHLLAGYRDVPPARRAAIIEVMLALSQMAVSLPEIAELDVNPLLADADGVIALDARIILTRND